MNKILILLACMISLVMAGVMDNRRMLNENNADQIGADRITIMSRDELLRQKFLLDVLQHVQQPLANEELLALASTLIMDQNKYTEQIDEEMLHVIELSRQQRLLGKQEAFTIADEDHLLQMVGLYRLLVRASDWDTFQRNAAYARKHINGVLLVNALLLAVRDRADTQTLIVPAIHELLPEIYWDAELVRKVRTINMDALVTDTETLKPGLMDMIGLGRRTRLLSQQIATGKSPIGMLDRAQLWMPWHEMRMEMGVRKNGGERTSIVARNENKLVLPVLPRQTALDGSNIDLLTEDVALKSFVHGLINNLILETDERLNVQNVMDGHQVGGRTGQLGRVNLEQNVGGSMLDTARLQNRWDANDISSTNDEERWGRESGIGLDRDANTMSQQGSLQANGDDALPTSNSNNARLLHVGRRRQQIAMNEHKRLINTPQRTGNGNEGRRLEITVDSDENIDDEQRRNLEQDAAAGHRRLRQINTDEDDDEQASIRMANIQGDRTWAGRQGSNLNDQRSAGSSRMNIWESDDETLNRGIGGMGVNRRGVNMLDDLPTTSIDDERLLHVNQRRYNQRIIHGGKQQQRSQAQSGSQLGQQQNILIGRRQNDDDDDMSSRSNNWQQQQGNQADTAGRGMWSTGRQQNTLMGRRTNDDDDDDMSTRGSSWRQERWNQQQTLMGRRVSNADDSDDNVSLRGNNMRNDFLNVIQGGQRMLSRNADEVRGVRGMNDLGIIRSSIDNDRLLKVNRRRLNNNNNDMNINDEGLLHRGGIEDLRVNKRRGMEDIGTERDDRQQPGLRGAYDDDISMGTGMRRRLPRSLRSNMIDSNDRRNMQQARAGEVLVHNLQQLLARINMDQIALGSNQLQDDTVAQSQRINNPRLLDAAGQRYVLRLNEMRLGGRRDRQILERINEIEQRLNTVLQQQLRRVMPSTEEVNAREQTVVNRVIGDLLIDGKIGGMNVLNMLSEIILQTESIEGPQTLTQLGVGLNDRSQQHLLRRLVKIIDLQSQQLGSYQREDLQLQGVNINDVVIDKLSTHVDVGEADLINLLDSRVTLSQQRAQKMVVARQQRLNHKSFSINVDLSSNRNQRVVVRTILMPKIDGNGRQLQLEEQRLNALVLDATLADLQVGRNLIKRKSRDIAWTARDATPYSQLYERVMMAIEDGMGSGMGNGIDVGVERVSGQNCRFPHRLLLPRGRVEGLPMQLLVIVTPVEGMDRQVEEGALCGIGIGSQNLDMLPLGFPLDRPIENMQQLVGLSNVILKDVSIYHEDKQRMDIL